MVCFGLPWFGLVLLVMCFVCSVLSRDVLLAVLFDLEDFPLGWFDGPPVGIMMCELPLVWAMFEGEQRGGAGSLFPLAPVYHGC